MSIGVGSLAVHLTARTAEFRRKMRGASDAVGVFRKGAAGAVAALGGVGAALGGLASARSAWSFVSRAAEDMDRMSKFASRIGMTVENFSSLAYAAQLSGIGMTQMGTAIQRMTRRIGEAAKGTGEARGALKELGLDVKALVGSGSPTAALMQVADRLADVESGFDRTRLAMKLFDSEGVQMVNMLANGSDELRRFMAEADRLGVTITKAEAAASERIMAARTRLSGWLEGAGQKSVLFADWLVNSGGVGKKLIGGLYGLGALPLLSLLGLGNRGQSGAALGAPGSAGPGAAVNDLLKRSLATRQFDMPAAQRGTREAYSIIHGIRQRDDLVRLQREAAEMDKQRNRLLQESLSALRRGTGVWPLGMPPDPGVHSPGPTRAALEAPGATY